MHVAAYDRHVDFPESDTALRTRPYLCSQIRALSGFGSAEKIIAMATRITVFGYSVFLSNTTSQMRPVSDI